MAEDYAQHTSALSSLKHILDGYPLSIGIFRELIQNSEDAGATRQIFVLDRRNHPTEGLTHRGLGAAQGPALLAFNDGIFKERDWEALKTIHESSKSSDSAKIGKYGVGFRSVFNITDCPQILSNTSLAIFDPLCNYLESEGKKFTLGTLLNDHPRQLDSFEPFWAEHWTGAEFKGTVVRCPLRKKESHLKGEVADADLIRRLLQDFINQEVGIAFLFLKSLKSLEIREISAEGVSQTLVTMSISAATTDTKSPIRTVSIGNQPPKVWHVVQPAYVKSDVIDLLSRAAGCNPASLASTLTNDKLMPEIGIATDLSVTTKGRLFTYLPLPIYIGSPTHIHALFAIDSSRRYLKSPNDIGLQPGSRDHTLVAWNKLLFNTYIPKAWSQLLESVACADVPNIFDVWPAEQSARELGALCGSLPGRVLAATVDSNVAVWPIYAGLRPTQPAQYASLDALSIAGPSVGSKVLDALGNIGIRLTRPPPYIFKLMTEFKSDTVKLSILTPERARQLLLGCIEQIRAISEAEQKSLLDFLLSTKDVRNIVGLPLIEVASKQKVALKLASETNARHTLMTRAEFDVFGGCDDGIISLQEFSFGAAEALRAGVGLVNVEFLEVPRIVQFLTDYPNRMSLDLSLVRTDAHVIKWLSTFWQWLKTYAHKDTLFPQIRSLYLIPSTHGLRKADIPLFRLQGLHPSYVQAFKAVHLPFIESDLSEKALEVMKSFGLVKEITDVSEVLALLPSPPPSNISPKDCETLLKFFASRSMNKPLTGDQLQRFKRLPIFPILSSSLNPAQGPSVVTTWSNIPEGLSVRSVGRPGFVPSIDGVVLVAFDPIAPTLIRQLQPDFPSSLSDVELLFEAVKHITTQPESLRAAALDYIVQNRAKVAPYIMAELRKQPFVHMHDGSYHIPGDVIDPESPISSLFAGNDAARRPRNGTPLEKAIIKALKSLGLLLSTLTLDIVQERAKFIASDQSPPSLYMSRNLFQLISTTHIDYSKLEVDKDWKWLPSNQGLRSASTCRDASTISANLFDRVFAVFEDFPIPTSLKKVLGWDQPIRPRDLLKQLDAVLQDGDSAHSIVVEILKAFSLDYSFGDAEELTITVEGRKWLPTTNKTLADMDSGVILAVEYSDTGFEQILPMDDKTSELLQRVGCSHSPTTNAIIAKLHALSKQPSPTTATVALHLLHMLPSELSDLQRARLLVPDKDFGLCDFKNVYFNDVGEQSKLVENSPDHSIAHDMIDEKLSEKLCMQRLGITYEDLREIGAEMGQTPLTTVQQTLARYTTAQFLVEFLANAADAGATEFTVILNDVALPRQHDLTREMGSFLDGPSLVIHNDGTFSEDDFNGICYSGIGSKTGRSDTIGEFGLGALSMFHFTEMAMIISGDSILLMDPSKKNLPYGTRASARLTLKHFETFFGDHLRSIDGILGFDLSDPHYNGTLFVLPLRRPNTKAEVSSAIWSPEDIRTNILDPFRTQARDCLLFTKLITVQCIDRDLQRENVLWSYTAHRSAPDLEIGTHFSHVEVDVVDATNQRWNWLIATSSPPREQLPAATQALTLRRGSVAALAALRHVDAREPKSYRFFSTLPLEIPTQLPMQIMGTFLLTQDRRHIRLEGDDSVAQEYNKWLLHSIIPPLYLYVLETLMRIPGCQDNEHWWPVGRSKEDKYSRLVVEGLYSDVLKTSDRKVFSNPRGPLTAQEAVISGDEPASVYRALTLLGSARLVTMSASSRKMADKAGIAKVSPTFVREEIMRESAAITSNLERKDLAEIVEYLASDKGSGGKGQDDKGSPDYLVDLPILALQDNSYGTFLKAGPPTYFLWKPKQTRRHDFAEKHFVHADFKVKGLSKMNLNVGVLGSHDICSLLEERLATQGDPSSLTEEDSSWMTEFWNTWEEYALLGLKSDDIAAFPLVPSSHGYVTINDCKEGRAFIFQGKNHEDTVFRTCFARLGLKIVWIESERIPPSLRSILSSSDFPDTKFENVVHELSQLQQPISQIFANLDEDQRNAFAAWAQKTIQGPVAEDLLDIAQQLPIWMAMSSDDEPSLHSSSEIYLLPGPLSMSVAGGFMCLLVSDNQNLKHLQAKDLSLVTVGDNLNLPSHLDESTLASYKTFLRVWMSHTPIKAMSHFPVPATTGSIKYSSDMYSRTPFFEAVLGETSDNFLHPDFESFEEELKNYGLKHEEKLDFDMFKNFLINSGSDSGEGSTRRAAELFRVYGGSLPLLIRSEQNQQWTELDDYEFIPRRKDETRRIEDQGDPRAGLPIPRNVTELGDVVAPLEVVRAAYEAIAWSQRASLDIQPDEILLRARPEFGRPTNMEVIAHLRYLAYLGSQCRHTLIGQHRSILVNDLHHTYTYLQNVITDLDSNEGYEAEIIRILSTEPLFLNVDDPLSGVASETILSQEQWHWDCATEMIFDNGAKDDDYDQSGIRPVRTALEPYSKLLDVLGVLKVHYPTFHNSGSAEAGGSDLSRRNSTPGFLELLRSGFEKQRKNQLFTDVEFVPAGECDSDDREHNRRPLFAHRSFLAAAGEYFDNLFCGPYTESAKSSSSSSSLSSSESSRLLATPLDPDSIVKIKVEQSRECVAWVLDYIYTARPLPPAESISLDVVLEILHLSGYWHLLELFEDVQREIIVRRMIKPDTLERIRGEAELIHAETLLRYCLEYESSNAEFIRRVRGDLDTEANENHAELSLIQCN